MNSDSKLQMWLVILVFFGTLFAFSGLAALVAGWGRSVAELRAAGMRDLRGWVAVGICAVGTAIAIGSVTWLRR